MEDQDDDADVYIPVHKRRMMKVQKLKEKKSAATSSASTTTAASVASTTTPDPSSRSNVSLLDQALQSIDRKNPPAPVDPSVQEEKEIVDAVTSFRPLLSHQELARDVIYTEAMRMTDWAPPSWTKKIPQEAWEMVRQKHRILMEGEEPLPPPLERFVDMKLPSWLVASLDKRGIRSPSPIQMQGIPVALAGRDMIGIAFTGSGKTLVFALPLFCYALHMELNFPLKSRQGPLGMIVCPSRELAEQSYEIICGWARAGVEAGAPEVRAMLCIGGTSVRESFAQREKHGVHVVVATPGRLLHLLKEHMLDLDVCRYLCLDEADRLIDLGFEEPIRDIMSFFKHQRQTLLFSATMPLKIAQFAKSALVKPVIVNVGRAGAAALTVRQDVEYVADEDRLLKLLKTLQKTAPPVLIFAENQRDVDEIHEFLLTKNVEAVSIHGGKLQEERKEAIKSFKSGEKDVLVSTDVGAKGLDFPSVQHVINYDMPQEIENYVHRIGRTGRGGKKGVATTYLGPNCQQTVLLDLRGLLEEARQVVPDFLARIQGESFNSAMQSGNTQGCVYCGGLGHRIMDCPKLEGERRKQLASGVRADMGGNM